MLYSVLLWLPQVFKFYTNSFTMVTAGGGDNSEPQVSEDEDELICDISHSDTETDKTGNYGIT